MTNDLHLVIEVEFRIRMNIASTNFAQVISHEDIRGLAGVAGDPTCDTIPERVMTEEQILMLAKQISAYGSICKQLIEMHNTIVVQQNALNGFTPGQALTFNSVMGFVGHKMTTRQRWTPSQTQLQILENIFEKGKGTPCKQRIKEITAQLSKHGHISETNVYNWFQNRRARTKRKQQTGFTGSGEYEMDNLLDSSIEKKAKFDESSGQETSLTRQGNGSYQNQESVSEYNKFDSQQHKSSTSFSSQVASKATDGFNRSAPLEHGFSVTR